jgi:hypothetical protein
MILEQAVAPLSTAEPAKHECVSTRALTRWIPLTVWGVCLLALLWIPFKVISYGYLPNDDALRHAAKALSGRDWQDILVIRKGLEMDHNPGWHWILGNIHRATGLGADGLVTVSLIALFLVAMAAPMAGFDRPEAWVGSLLIGALTFPAGIYRVLLGRPFAVMMATTIAILLLWRKQDRGKPSTGLLVTTVLLLALSAWVHGSWYLFALVIAAFALANRLPAAAWLSGCWIIGSLLGASLTGHPIAYLANAIRIAMNSFGGQPLTRMLVAEFQPSDGNVLAILTIVGLLLLRYLAGDRSRGCLNDPILILAVLGWMLGLRVLRFSTDLGAPAFLLWVALELREHFARRLAADSVRRAAVTVGLSLSLFFVITADTDSRWTKNLDTEYLSQADPEMRPWLPDKGGILYNSDMTIFYQTFFKNPDAPWRYILGFEPTFMPEEDLQIFRNLQRNFRAYQSFAPWVAEMRAEDRLVVHCDSPQPPAIPGLEWHYTARDLWIGRKPRPSG